MPNTILELKGLTKRYKSFTFGPVDLCLPTGCITGFIGENGAGKTTTLSLIEGLIRPDVGTVSVFGREDYLRDPNIFDQLGIVLDICGLHENLAARNVRTIMRGLFKTWDDSVFDGYMERFRLSADKRIKDYSQGMRRKLNIAVALSHHARLLLLDEPTSGLDPIVRDELLDVFLEFMQQSDDRAIFLSSHILSDLEKACDYIAFLHEGKLVFCEPKDTLSERYYVIKCTEEELLQIPAEHVHGIRRNRFGTEALCERGYVPEGVIKDPASIEDIMLFFIKEGRI